MAISLNFPFQSWCRTTFHKYVVFTKSIIFILGLILSYKLVEKTFLNILITRLTEAWDMDDYDIRRAAIVVNLQDGLSGVLVILFAYLADVHTGHFKMVISSTVVCIIGLLLCMMAAGNEDDDQLLNFGYFYPALGLLTLAEAAIAVTLQAFLDDQLRPRDLTAATDDDPSRFWWYLVSIVAALFAQFGPLAELPFKRLTIILSSLMGAALLLFLLGTKYYIFVSPIRNPFKDVGAVILRAIRNRKANYPQHPHELSQNSSGDLLVSPSVPWLRWLDRAAITQQDRGSACSSVEQVRRAKLLLKMLPLWCCLLTISMVAASGSTFFLEEAYSISPKTYLRAALFFANLQRLTEVVASKASAYVVRKLGERWKYKEQKVELVRIGIGMYCCVPCCIAAWAIAVRRQQLIEDSVEEDEDGNAIINMSVYLLTPQYFLLGVTGGLAGHGLQSFYESQVSESSLSRFGPSFGEFVTGVGRFVTIVCVLVLSRTPLGWLKMSLDESRLDHYYILLVVLSLGNVVIYCFVACWYGDDNVIFPLQEEEAEIQT